MFYSSALIKASKETDVKFNSPYGETWDKYLSQVNTIYKQEIRALAKIIDKGIGNNGYNDYIPYCTNLLASIIFVGSTDSSSSALITERNEIDVKYNTPYGEGLTSVSSEALIPNTRQLSSSARINLLRDHFKNEAVIPYMEGIHSVASINESSSMDVKYNTPYGEDLTSVPSEAIIKNRQHFAGNAGIELLGSHLENELIIPFMEGIHSTASINENLSLDVILGILQPPQSILTIDAFQDTYTRQARPYNNYGYLHTLAVGKASEGEFITYIDFDLTELIKIKDQAIISIDFHIDQSSGRSEKIDVYECFSSWSEGFLMWANTMYYSEDPIFSFTAGDTVDITMLVKALMDSGKTKFKLMLKSDELSTFQSKESGAPPQLIITYANPEWIGFIGDVTEYCSAVIRSDSRKVFHSMFNILHKSLQPSVAVLREKGLKEAEATVVSPLFGGRAEVLANSIALNSTAMIMNTSDLSSSFDKNASEYSNIADILTKNIFHSFAEVAPGQAYDWKGHRADIKATASFADSFADILDKIFSHGSAYIKPYNEVPGAAYVTTPFLLSEAILTKHGNIFSEAMIGNAGTKDQVAEACVSYRNDFASKAFIINTLDYDLYSESLIIKADRSNLYTHSYIKHSYDINSQGILLNANELYVPSEAILRVDGLHDLQNSSTINELLHLMGGANILRHENNNILNTAYIMIPDKVEHNAEAYLNKIITFENEATLYQLSQLVGEAIVRRSDKHNIYSQSELFEISTLPSHVDIREISQIAGQAIIREEGVMLYLATAFLNGWYPFDTLFCADILATGNFKYSYATIRNNARVWTPPPTAGKLPRVWRWEDFSMNA